MSVRGQLTKEQFGYSVPLDAPLYPPYPVLYEDVTMLVFPYVTSAAAAARILPEQFDVAPVPGDADGTLAIAMVMFAHYGDSSIGPYNEVAQVVYAHYRDPVPAGVSADVGFAVRLHVDSDAAMAFGREVGGFPKKMGHIAFDVAAGTSALEIPQGTQVCSGALTTLQKFDDLTAPNALPFCSVRLLPNPAPFKRPIRELIYTEWVQTDGAFWSAKGTLSLDGSTPQNPYGSLPVVQMLPPRPSIDGEGTCVFRGRMQIAKVLVLEDF